ncbi:MAG: hypothetical protein PHE18_04520 [Candidatus Omnitrophica bacterium]|nr:hypothetical protein [Candidatus Omnitrophota bacterium]MDD5553123.1 hypothetical protein [Candidatus Omnitrophota bacterium]
MRKYPLLIICLGILVSLSACTTCRTAYKEDLTADPRLQEANISYKKALEWIEKAECDATMPAEAEEAYRKADSYLSDSIFKLNEIGHYENIDVDDEVFYAETVKSHINVKEGDARKAKMP